MSVNPISSQKVPTSVGSQRVQKVIALVGHCGPDMSYLMLAAKKAVDGVVIERINDESSLQKFLTGDTGLMLVNRELDGDFGDKGGVELIGRAFAINPRVMSMLISNYQDAQTAAVKAGALSGFGKRDIGSAKVLELLKNAF